MKYSLCDGWTFFDPWPGSPDAAGRDGVPVRLPHTPRLVPLHGAGPEHYEGVYGYRRTLELPPSARGKRVFLQFDGAGHIATVYVNGHEAATHRCGYTAFRCEVTHLLDPHGPNRLDVRLDATENPAVPPFGFVIDYLTYGGLYREVWLDAREESFIGDIFVITPDLTTAQVQLTLDAPKPGQQVEAVILQGDKPVAQTSKEVTGEGPIDLALSVPGAQVWDLDHPNLYVCRVTLKDPRGRALDVQEAAFGFRTAQWRSDGFYLNGEKVFLRGLDRHQCWPYVGYAVPAALQREDARILKEELGCNCVRTSHYPQSQHFLDACDALGLLVFTELPGWQHIGDAAWKAQALENLREMVVQYRNHPSVVLWGVRINESVDDDDFYRQTNALAHELDPSRCTSGVRNFEMSHLLEDVYAYNDFSCYEGITPPPAVKPKRDVTPDMDKALLISEHSGHMYPTKPFDDWPHRLRHALRHARILNDAIRDGDHAGCIGWCMFDYPTHGDFGAGDRVCYHGVMDAFRNPKLAAYFYESQGDGHPVLEVGSPMDIGEYPAGLVGAVAVFTNAQKVLVYRNGVLLGELEPGELTALPHPPKVLPDITDESTGAWGGWGGKAPVWQFDAVRDGQVVRSVTRGPSNRFHLEVRASHTELREGDAYDMAAVRVRVVDEYGALAPYLQLPVSLTLTGPAELIGPGVVTAEGGMCGTYLKTTGQPGHVTLTLSTPQTPAVELSFTVTVE